MTTTSGDYPTTILVLFLVFYSTCFIVSITGNTWVLLRCYKNLKQRYYPFTLLLTNLASADLLFTFLTIFNGIGFMEQWVGGNITCKLQGFLLEASYTTTVTTLVAISQQRLMALVDPFSVRISSWSKSQRIKLILMWSFSLLVCSPLIYIYRVKTNENGDVVCLTTTRGNKIPQIFYSVHTTIFFVVPMLYMICTQSRIYRSIRVAPKIINTSCLTQFNKRHRKAAKTLVALTTAFVICWSPFMVIRTLLQFHLASPGLFWRMSQLLIFLNAGLDPLLYGYYGGNMKSSLKRVLCR